MARTHLLPSGSADNGTVLRRCRAVSPYGGGVREANAPKHSEGERRQRIEETRTLPWRQRPRPTAWAAFPQTKFVAVLLAFPYICLGTLIYWAVRGWRPEEVQRDVVPVLLVLTVVAVAESIAIAAWLRRPTSTSRRADARGG